MPGWYAKLSDELKNGSLQAIGLIQEQHPQRTELFNQWKQLDMKLLVDPLNALDVTAVPIVLLVDESGVIRHRNPSVDDVHAFLKSKESSFVEANQVPGQQWSKGDKAALEGRVDDAIEHYQDALKTQPESGRLHFRLGVAYRMKYDSAGGTPSDFVAAVDHWKRALDLDPNQYIWRRRIQQYGPILDKPYPFYNWVETARAEIEARGEQPVELSVEPQGAELAGPKTKISTNAEAPSSPDPQGKIRRDEERAVTVKTTVVPSTNSKQRALRVHLLLEPNHLKGFAWNNEADPVRLWLDSNDDCIYSEQLIELPLPATATSEERRTADIEVRWSDDAPESITGYVLYHVCDKDTGVCLYRRRDVSISLR